MPAILPRGRLAFLMQAVKGRYNDGFGTIVGPAATATGRNAKCCAVEDMPGYGRVAGDLLQKVD